MAHYWIAVASREHVLRGVSGGFAQVCHGKPGPLQKMAVDDWIVYYSPTEEFGQPLVCRRFTAIGRILPDEPYQHRMREDFTPWRRNVKFLFAKETPIEPLITSLSFIRDKRRWGFPFRRGCFSVPRDDFRLIAAHMDIHLT